MRKLIEVFAEVAETDELALYRDLVTADRDVVRVRVPEGEGERVNVSDGVALVHGARDMLLAAARKATEMTVRGAAGRSGSPWTSA